MIWPKTTASWWISAKESEVGSFPASSPVMAEPVLTRPKGHRAKPMPGPWESGPLSRRIRSIFRRKRIQAQ